MKIQTLAFGCAALACALASTAALAKLPPPNDEAKAKAAEATAKTAHSNKVANYQLCKSMDQVAVNYFAKAKKDGTPVKPADAGAAACADPGAFVYTPAPPLEAAGAHSPPATAAAPPNTKTPQAATPAKP